MRCASSRQHVHQQPAGASVTAAQPEPSATNEYAGVQPLHAVFVGWELLLSQHLPSPPAHPSY